MSFHSVHRKDDVEKGWAKRASRVLLHDVTDELQKAKVASEQHDRPFSEEQEDSPFSEEEFLPALARAVLCRGLPAFSANGEPPSGCLLCYTTKQSRNKNFPQLARVDLGDTGDPRLPTVPNRTVFAAANGSYTPLPGSSSEHAGKDRFWQMLKAKEEEVATGNQMATGTVLICELYRLFKHEHGRVPKLAELISFLQDEDTKRKYINLEPFYENAKRLGEACKNCITNMKEETKKGRGQKAYFWHPRPGSACAEKINAAIETGKLIEITMAAELGMTKPLFNKLVTIRKEHQQWRSTRTATSCLSHRSFKEWHYHQSQENSDSDNGS